MHLKIILMDSIQMILKLLGNFSRKEGHEVRTACDLGAVNK